MKPRPSVPVPIAGIIRTTEDAVLVRLPSGRSRWVPRDHAEFSPGHVLLPAWLASKIREQPDMKKLSNADLTDEEQYILQVIRAARVIQEFLWADMNVESGLEEFRRMFRKRVAKIEAISMDNPHWQVELNKRLLQTAAICVNLMAKIANGRLTHDGIHPTLPSNLPDYNQPIDNPSGRRPCNAPSGN
jgi:hypothetical protein